MKIAGVSELKAKLAKYLRIVKSGEDVEIRERGVPIAILSRSKGISPLMISSAVKDPSRLAKFKFSVHARLGIDVVDFLLEDRKKR